MIRLAISVEGQTEEEFVNQVLTEHLRPIGVESMPVSLNGNVTIERLASDIARLFWSFDAVTSLVDYYGFRDKYMFAPNQLEQRIGEVVYEKLHRPMDQSRVIPYVQQYEFEGLLFSDVDAFRLAANASEVGIQELREVRTRFSTPEDINDNSETAPSKRIAKAIPRYNKVVDGSLIAKEIGLSTMRSVCPRFNAWITSLESLSN